MDENGRILRFWPRFWIRFSGTGVLGRMAAGLAAMGMPPFYGRIQLAAIHPKGYVSPKATLYGNHIELGRHVYIDDDVLIYQEADGGPVTFHDGVHLHRGTFVQTGQGGAVAIGERTHIQPRCQLSAYKGSISIGQRVEIAPNCAFYPYNHGMAHGTPIRRQPLRSRGGIAIGDDAWLGYGAVVLDGVRIGVGAVVGAGSVVTRDVPDGAIASGVPARIVKHRRDLPADAAAATTQPPEKSR
ncbi:acyltransferase [Desulfosarcina sp.]|uniref:acyltransferase n=1 Tax=Desulfosarcina sp. TaxID=2027861 RepID=UPI0039709D1D